MIKRESFEIVLGTTSVDAKVFLDGRELQSVSAVRVTADVNGVTRVELQMIPEKVTISAAAMAELDAHQVKALVDVTPMGHGSRMWRWMPVVVERERAEPS